jgi:hypothetical protein
LGFIRARRRRDKRVDAESGDDSAHKELYRFEVGGSQSKSNRPTILGTVQRF